jgi:CRISPR-associated protein Cmr2
VEQHIDKKLWDEQAGDVIEFYAAWTPLAKYKDSRQRLMRLLGGRKACRTFKPVRGRAGVPKSSLDGARESVWLRSFATTDLPEDLAVALRLSRGEELDCVGLTKRLGERQNFPSVSRIAADAWIRGLPEDVAAHLRDECKRIGAHILGEIKWTRYKKFPFEGIAVYRNRYPEIEETGTTRLQGLSVTMKRIEKDYGTPDPYLAVLIADGDHMGEQISRMESAQDHREFSNNLAKFAEEARKVVERHQGCAVYAGGDDVLAFVPVDQALACARALHDSFGSFLPDATLSVGIAIGHFMEPLEDLLQHARDAERNSKLPDRNGLAVHLYPRSGAPVTVRRRWSENPDQRISQWSGFFTDKMLSSKAAYNVHELARDYKNWPETINPGETIRDDVLRLLSRKEISDEARQKLRDQLSQVESHKDLHDLAQELLIARRISQVEIQAKGSR